MTDQVLQALGGLGLFLLGMIVLTEGLRALAGDAVHRILFRFTKSPTSGALTGAGLTAVLQSSSLTTVATVGFVSAGLLTFPQALGILFGANIGTTATGWMVALLGFKLSVGQVVLPLLLAGTLLRLMGRGRIAHAGWALAGFALIFLGIEALQQGMAGFEGAVTPERFPGDGLTGRLKLVGIGVVVTLVTQSSSAGVAMALAAVDAGALSFAQAAAMVIGMDVGTTSTTAIATIGGSPETKRTGYSHVVYNLLTGVLAFLLLDPYLYSLERFLPGGLGADSTLALVGFHTAFNGLGVVLVLPATGAFARLMYKLVPERGPDLTGKLVPTLLKDPYTAGLTLVRSVRAMSAELFDAIARALAPRGEGQIDELRIERVDRAVDTARRFADGIIASPNLERASPSLVASMHALDHLDRLVERCRRPGRLQALRKDASLAELTHQVRSALRSSRKSLLRDEGAPDESRLQTCLHTVEERREPYRREVLADVSRGKRPLDGALPCLDAIRWLQRTLYHACRIVHHLAASATQEQEQGLAPSPRAEPEVAE